MSAKKGYKNGDWLKH